MEYNTFGMLCGWLLMISLSACSGGGGEGSVEDPRACDAPFVASVAVQGKVVDEHGSALAHVHLQFARESVEIMTDAEGAFATELRVGPHALTVHQEGVALYDRMITIQADGTLAELGNTVVVPLAGDPGHFKDTFIAELPQFHVEPPTPTGATAVTVTLNAPAAQHLALAVQGEGCGSLHNLTVQGERLRQTATVGLAGQCLLEARVTTGAMTALQTAAFTVVPRVIPLPALRVLDGEYRPGGALSDADPAAERPVIRRILGPRSIRPGQVARFALDAADPDGLEDILRLHVALDSAPGFFLRPVAFQDGLILCDVVVDHDFFEGTAAVPTAASASDRLRVALLGNPLTLVFQLVDRRGYGSNQVRQEVTVLGETPGLAPASDAPPHVARAQMPSQAAQRPTIHVAGRATYEDFPPTNAGLSRTSTMLPIRYARVQARRACDNTLLAETDTDENGQFSLTFTNAATPGYYVSVLAEQDNAYVRQRVVDDQGDIYGRESDVINESISPVITDLQLEARLESAGPAFNIFDMGVLGAALVRAYHRSTPPLLTWLWTRNQPGACPSQASCYQASRQRISVHSAASDPDEYDDLVLLHEFGHFHQHIYATAESPGGKHQMNAWEDPLLAWGEGSATFFGNFSKGTSVYLDTGPLGLHTRVDLESLSLRIPLGTETEEMDGNVSEAVVAAILWDLADATNEAPQGDLAASDTVTSAAGVFTALAYARGLPTSQRGRGRAGMDLVDFLDAWFCAGNGQRGDSSTGVEGIVNGLYQFPYDFAAPVCQ